MRIIVKEKLAPRFGLKESCAALELPISTYYYKTINWETRDKPYKEALEDYCLDLPQSGYQNATLFLKQSMCVNKKRIYRIAKKYGLQSKQKKRRNYATTYSNHKFRKYPDLLVEKRVTKDLTGVIVGDVTAFDIKGVDHFSAFLTDLTNHETIGVAVSKRNDTALVLAALADAASHRRSLCGYIHHTDSDVRYCSDDYVDEMERLGLKISMCVGNAYENAHAESFNAVAKRQEINVSDYDNLAGATESQLVFRAKHSMIRPHSANGGLSPVAMGFRLGIYSEDFKPSYAHIHTYSQRKKKVTKKKETNYYTKV